MVTAHPRKIYVASSWRNPYHQSLVDDLRKVGHEVYDFRNPTHADASFNWADVIDDFRGSSGVNLLGALTSPIPQKAYTFDKVALDWADTCILLLPCGRSAHLEAGYMIGSGKPTLIVMQGDEEPELMYLLAGANNIYLNSKALHSLNRYTSIVEHVEYLPTKGV